MKKTTYCKECGEQIINGQYCPICGAKTNNSQEVKKMQKEKRTRNILLGILVITLIIIAGVFTYTLFFNEQYQKVKLSDSASLEMPVGKGLKGDYINDLGIYEVNNGKGVVVKSFNSNNPDLASAFAFSGLKESIVGSRFNDDQLYETTVNGSKVWSIATKNNVTHDNIIITTPNKELTMKIYKSIKYNSSKNDTNNDTTTSNQQTGTTNNDNQQKNVRAYKSDGTPMYDLREVDSYMERKYGSDVQWHIQDNGYISHDGYRQSNHNPTPSGSGGIST